MASIPLPALDVRPPAQQPDPIEQYARVSSLKNLQNQQQLQQQQIQGGQLENQMRQQQLSDQQASTAAMKEWDGKDFNQLPALILKHGGSAQTVMSMKQGLVKYQTDLASLSKEQLANEKTKNDYIAQQIDNVKGLPKEQQAAAFEKSKSDLVQKGYLDPQQAQAIQYQGPDQLDILEKSFMGHAAAVESAEKQAQTSKDLAQGQAAQVEAQKNQRVMQGMSPTGITAEQQAQLAQGNKRLSMEGARLAEERRHNQATEGTLTPDALDMAAQQFASTGQMPNVGRGGAVRSQIINAAAQKFPKVDLATNSAAYKANEASLKNVTGTLDTLTAFESTGLKNLKQFTDLADKIPDTGVPWLNKPVRVLTRNMVGDQNMAAVEAARNVALREIARVTNDPKLAGTLTDSSRQEVAGLIPQNATLPQIKAVAKILQQDMANVHGSLQDQKTAIQQRLGTSATGGNGPTSSGGGLSVKAPNGKTYTFKDQDAADSFRKRAGIQ